MFKQQRLPGVGTLYGAVGCLKKPQKREGQNEEGRIQEEQKEAKEGPQGLP